jgi:hypothetical protein
MLRSVTTAGVVGVVVPLSPPPPPPHAVSKTKSGASHSDEKLNFFMFVHGKGLHQCSPKDTVHINRAGRISPGNYAIGAITQHKKTGTGVGACF